MFQGLKNQLIQEAKTSWKKAIALLALFGLLVVVCVMQFGGSSKPKKSTSVTRKAPTPRQQTKRTARPRPAPSVARNPAKQTSKPKSTGFDWELAEEMFKTNPLVQPVAVGDFRTDPFQVDFDQFSPPIVFEGGYAAVKDDDEKKQISPPKNEQLAAPAGMELKSTIIGSSRRNALINRKLYTVGSDIRIKSDAGDKTYTVMAISPRKVILVCDTIMYELKIASRIKDIDIQRTTIK
jgi:hypothetical protein